MAEPLGVEEIDRMFRSLVALAAEKGAVLNTNQQDWRYGFMLHLGQVNKDAPFRLLGTVNADTDPNGSFSGKSEIVMVKGDPTELVDVVTIAHELGHHLNWLAGEPLLKGINWFLGWDYSLAVWREENRAWHLSVEPLKRVGFKDWALFEAAKKYALGTYWNQHGPLLSLGGITREEADKRCGLT